MFLTVRNFRAKNGNFMIQFNARTGIQGWIDAYSMRIKNRGLANSIVHHTIQLFLPLLKAYALLTNQSSFTFCEKKYTYAFSRYGATWSTERAVEVPIFLDVLNKALAEKKTILEIGNVMEHYMPAKHTGLWAVVDKYEVAPDIINQDIAEFSRDTKYNFILSVSTMEHVGFDEEDKDNNKIIKAIDNIVQNLLTPDGIFIFSVPFGFNPTMDEIVFGRKIKLSDVCFMKRYKMLDWKQVDEYEVKNSQYGNIYYGSADAVAIAVINSKEKIKELL